MPAASQVSRDSKLAEKRPQKRQQKSTTGESPGKPMFHSTYHGIH